MGWLNYPRRYDIGVCLDMQTVLEMVFSGFEEMLIASG